MTIAVFFERTIFILCFMFLAGCSLTENKTDKSCRFEYSDKIKNEVIIPILIKMLDDEMVIPSFE